MFQTIFDLIDIRAFSSIWYWILVLFVWRTIQRRVLVELSPRLVVQARSEPEAATLVAAALHARPVGSDLGGVARGSCVSALLVMLGFVYGFEFAQALALIYLPVFLVALLDLRAAHRAVSLDPGEPQARFLLGHHMLVQFIGFAAIGVTALYGMVRVLRAHYLGT